MKCQANEPESVGRQFFPIEFGIDRTAGSQCCPLPNPNPKMIRYRSGCVLIKIYFGLGLLVYFPFFAILQESFFD
jgi:hypothetical protein